MPDWERSSELMTICLPPWRGDGQLASGAAENEIKESAITAKHASIITLLHQQNELIFFLYIFNK